MVDGGVGWKGRSVSSKLCEGMLEERKGKGERKGKRKGREREMMS